MLNGTVWKFNDTIAWNDSAGTMLNIDWSADRTKMGVSFLKDVNTGIVYWRINGMGAVPFDPYLDGTSAESIPINGLTLEFVAEPDMTEAGLEYFMAWLTLNATQNPSQTYTVKSTELKAIANAIRSKIPNSWSSGPTPVNGSTNYVLQYTAISSVSYTSSVHLTQNLDPSIRSSTLTQGVNVGGRIVSHPFKTAAGAIEVSFTLDLPAGVEASDFMLMKGSEVVARFDDALKIAYPDGFVDGIDGIPTLVEGTSDATATASDIVNGKTAYVNGEKLTGTLVPLDTSDATAAKTDIKSGKTAYVNGSKLTGTYVPYATFGTAVTSLDEVDLIIPAGTYNTGSTVTFPFSNGFDYFVESITSWEQYRIYGPTISASVGSLTVDAANKVLTATVISQVGFTSHGAKSEQLQIRNAVGVFYPVTIY